MVYGLSRIYLEVQRVCRWLYSKRSELAQVQYRDFLMAHIIFEILRTSTRQEFKFITLYHLNPIHPVNNRENTIRFTQERVKNVLKHKNSLLKKREISKEDMIEILPSANYVRAIQSKKGSYYTFEGNGRIAALKEVFLQEDKIEVEVCVYYPKNLKRALAKIKKLKKMYGSEFSVCP